MEDPWWRKFLARLIFWFLIISAALVGAYLGLAMADTNASGEDSYWPIVFGFKPENSMADGLGVMIGLLLGYSAFPFLMRGTGLVSERTLKKMWWKPTYRRRTQAETSQRRTLAESLQLKDPWWRRFLAHLILWSLMIGGIVVGVYLGMALGETIATGENAFWPFDIHRRYDVDLVHGVSLIFGLAMGLLAALFVFLFLMHVTGLVSRGTVETMLENPRYQVRTQAETSRMEEARWRRFLAYLLFFLLVIGGLAVGGYLGLALVETIATGDNAFWPFEFGRPYGPDLVHGVVVVLGLAIGCLLGGFVFLFLMRVTGLVSERTLEKMV